MAKMNPYLKQAVKEAKEKERADKQGEKRRVELSDPNHHLKQKMGRRMTTEHQRNIKREKQADKNKFKDWDKW